MLSLLRRRAPVTARIDGVAIRVEPKETLLQAALRQGVDFPSSCRVGGCGACRCRVVSGEVRELTESGYLLTEQELAERTVLACQTVPRTDVEIRLDTPGKPPRRRVQGHVVAQARLTHDLTRLTVQLDAPLAYLAGQFAELTLASLPGVSRSYSFASAPSDDGRVTFVVRHVTGGAFSSRVHEGELVGEGVTVDGPLGDFRLRPGDGPMLLVAGGSGLAPILALLQDAAARGIERPVTLLFGARAERDLYALDELRALERAWRGPFRFVPVLSDAPADAAWTGERGLVTELIPRFATPDVQAWLCGPPGMVDRAAAVLDGLGVRPRDVFADRFTTRHEAAAPVVAAVPDASPWQYLKFFLFHAIGLYALTFLVLGGAHVTWGLLTILGTYVIGDAVLGDDVSTPRYRHPGILTAQLWLALPLLATTVFVAVWSVCAGDPLGFGALVQQLTGYDALAARDATTFGHHVSTFVTTGLMIGLVGTITAHELTHRTWDPISMTIGRWLLAFSFDTIFAIEHVHGHHRYVSTEHDPATAPRGRSVYAHVLASTWKGNVSAWRIEAQRLARRRRPVWSWHNVWLRGHAMSLVLLGLAYAMGGWVAAGFFTACALWGKSLLEIVNYMEHYGMVRDPATPVQPRHSWNTNRRVSSWAMFNLTRHSHHHAQGEVPYQDLKPMSDAPMMVSGYLTTILLTLVPPVWHRLMTPKVLAWDREHASPEERRLAARANARSGVAALQRANEAVELYGGPIPSSAK